MLLAVGVVAVAAAGLAWALSSSSGQQQQQPGGGAGDAQPAPSPTPSTSGAKPPDSPAPALGTILSVGTAVVGVGAKVVGALGGASAGAGAAAGGAGAGGASAGAGAAGAGAGVAAAGGTASAAGGTTIAVTTLAPITIAPSLVVQGTVAATAGAAASAAALAPLYVVILFVIGSLIEKQQRYAKSWGSKVAELQPNARSLHFFERALVEKWWPADLPAPLWRDVRDPRLMRRVASEGVEFQGHRGVSSDVSRTRPGLGRAGDHMRVRRTAWVYLRERQRWGTAIGNARNVPFARQPFSWHFHDHFTGGNALGYTNTTGPYASLGGLKGVPMLDGRTQMWRNDAEEQYPAAQELLAPSADFILDDESKLTAEEVTTAKLAAFGEALRVYRHDPNAYVYLDAAGWRREYRDRVRREMGLTLAEAVDTQWSDATGWRYGFQLSAGYFGKSARVDPAAAKEQDAPVMSF